MPRLVIATYNPGKVREFAALLRDSPRVANLDLVSLNDLSPRPELPEETGTTFAENARIKAVAISQICGLPTLADDSGLCVDSLGGRPGIESARWAGPDATDSDRNIKLLGQLAGFPPERRAARFVCAVALALPSGGVQIREGVWPSSGVQVREGVWEGVIAAAPRGDTGFGYDPLFFLPDLGLTVAELPIETKNKLSHRARALEKLVPDLEALLFT